MLNSYTAFGEYERSIGLNLQTCTISTTMAKAIRPTSTDDMTVSSHTLLFTSDGHDRQCFVLAAPYRAADQSYAATARSGEHIT